MANELININFVRDPSIQELLGYSSNGEEIIKTLEQTQLSKLGTLALAAMQSTVPIKTGQLRNEHMILRNKNNSASVSVLGLPHTSSFQRVKLSSAILADTLDTGSFKRSRGSLGNAFFPGGYSGRTENWVRLGQSLFLSAIQ